MRTLTAQPITPEAFAPFGDVLVPPQEFARRYYSDGLSNGRPAAAASLSLSHVKPLASLPLEAVQMERHAFSSQSFMPLDVSRYLAIVAPHGADGGPDLDNVQAFLVPGDIGITYGRDVWHHPLSVLDRPGRFAIFMWLDGTTGDEEFVTLAAPFRVTVDG